MSTTWIIVIVVVAVIVLALLLGWLGRSRRTGKRREEAAGLREEAQTDGTSDGTDAAPLIRPGSYRDP